MSILGRSSNPHRRFRVLSPRGPGRNPGRPGWVEALGRLGLGLALGAGLLSCSGGGTSSPGVPPPTNVAVTYDSTSQVTVTWTPPAATVDGYDLEGCFQGQPFVQVNSALIPAHDNGATLHFTNVPPERSTSLWRMRSQAGSTFSGYSNTASFTFPLDPVTFLQVTPSATTPEMTVTWSQGSSLATQVILERATADADGQPSSTWTRLAGLPPASGSWTDTGVQESVSYLYRATNTDGVVTSAPALSTAQTISPFAPTGLTAVPRQAAVALTWTNRSASATAIRIHRSPAPAGGTDLLATLDPAATTCLDASLAPGQYTYSIEVTDGVRFTQGASVVAGPLNPAGAPVLLATPLPDIPAAANTAVLTSSGAWIAASFGNLPCVLYPPPGAAWDTWVMGDAALQSTGCLAADAQGLPHVVYGSTTTAAVLPGAFVHTWFDGQGWSSEKVTDYDGSGSGYFPTLAIDGAGNPKWMGSAGAASEDWASLRYFSRTAGVWSIEAAGAGLGTVNGDPAPIFALDPAGWPHLLLSQGASLLEVARAADGTWSAQAPVTDPNFAGAWPPGKGLWLDKDNAWFIFPGFNGNLPGKTCQIWAKAKVAGAWLPSILIDSFSTSPTWDAAITPDGSRLAVVITADRGPLVYLGTAQGWIGASIPATASFAPLLRTGFDSGGRLHILIQNVQSTDWHE